MSGQATIHRQGFGLKDNIAANFSDDYHSNLINFIISRGSELHLESLNLYLSKKFGFCYGVERAVEYAYETVQKFHHRKIYLLGEIVHNPFVNDLLTEMGVKIIDGLNQKSLDFSFLSEEDVIIIPAFGASHETLIKLHERQCQIVDATCGSVLSVWKRVEQYAKSGFTVLIHGKFPHEETNAICSQIEKYPDGRYIIVQNIAEAQMIADFLDGDISAELLLQKFANQISSPFSPTNDLQRIGFANQTTMLASESFSIANIIKEVLAKKFGEKHLTDHFQNLDTICSATQDRQEAVQELIKNRNLDFILIIGGFNSSNTNNLVRITSQQIKTFHVQDSTDIISENEIRCKPVNRAEPFIVSNWLPEGVVSIGITAGASTPNSKIEQVLRRLFSLKNISVSDLPELDTPSTPQLSTT